MRRILRKAVGFVLFVLLIGTAGIGMAAVAGLFVLGDLSGALKPAAVESPANPRGLIPVRYAKQDLPAIVDGAETDSAPAVASRIPPPLVAPTPEVVRVERAVPVLPDVPVRRAQPVLITASAPPVFDARAALSDDSIPRARPVAPDRVNVPDRPYALPANRSVAERDAVGLNW